MPTFGNCGATIKKVTQRIYKYKFIKVMVVEFKGKIILIGDWLKIYLIGVPIRWVFGTSN